MSWLNQPYQGGQPQQPPYLNQQQTGYQQPLQGQRTAFQPQPQFQQPQPTGYGGGGLRPQLPLQGQPTGYAPVQHPMATGHPGQQPQFRQQPSYNAYNAPPLPSFQSQPSYQGAPAPQSQFISTFMPSTSIQPSPYMDPSQMQFAQQPLSAPPPQQGYQQSPQTTGQQQQQIPIPWALTADEKKRYDQIFRAWDQQGTGFIGGAVAKEVFGQAGIERDDLMAIWNLADVEDRGKLNIDEFHVAMGLIYRRLNGNPIPTTLPPELAPPSARDLNDSVGFLTQLLKNDTNTRSTTADDFSSPGQGSYAKSRSLHQTAPAANRKDATVYRHDDSGTGTYKSSSRHLDRETVRYNDGGRESPRGELDDVKQRLKSTQSLLEKSRERDDEEEDLKDELRDLMRRIERVNEDLEHNLRGGRRTAGKDDEKRKLERELLKLEHEELPALERRLEERERDKQRDKKKYAMERDRRNDKYDKYDERRSGSYEDRERSRDRNRDDSRERERGYRRGTYDDDRRESSRPSSPPFRARAPPPPAPPPAAATKLAPPSPPPASAPTSRISSPAPSTASMTPEEKKAFIKAEAARRVQDRLRALGVAAPSDAPADTTIADRLEADRVEAKRKAEAADRELEAKELQRQAKLEREKLRGVEIEQSINERDGEKVEQVRREVEQAGPPATAARAAEEQLAAQDAAIKEREKALEKEKEGRMARVRQLEKDLAEAKEAEENFIKNKAKFANGAKAAAKVPPPPPPSRGRPPPHAPRAAPSTPKADEDDFAPPPPRAAAPAPSPPPPPPPAPTSPAAVSPPVVKTPSTNPFHKLGGAASTPSPALSKTNPFFPATAPPALTPPPAPAFTQAPPKIAFRPPPPPDDDWDSPAGIEKDESDSSDEEGFDRGGRAKFAQSLFSQIGLGAPSRPTSAAANAPPAAPAPPPAPRAPVAPSSTEPSTPVVPPSALLGQIQGGMRLKKTQTKDKSGSAVAGTVIGNASPPAQTSRPPSPPPSPPVREPSPPPPAREPSPPPPAREPSPPPPAREPSPEPVVEEDVVEEDPMEAVDLKTTVRMRSLYAYEGQRVEDLSFGENLVIAANPPKDPDSPWWYGKIESTGKAGWVPKSYIEEINAQVATALYAYAATSGDEFSFEEDATLSMVDTSDESWWKAEKGGIIGLVPATYFEHRLKPTTSPSPSSLATPIAIAAPTPPSSTAASAVFEPPPAADDSDSSSDDDSNAEPDTRSPKEREAERRRVLEAAGLLGRESAASPVKRRATRRAAPSRPPRTALPDAPSMPEEEVEEVVSEEQQEERMEDAYDLYQQAMRGLPPLPRRDSVDSTSFPRYSPMHDFSPPSSPSPSTATSGHRSDARLSVASSFISRVVAGVSRTTSGAGGERPRPVVSAPMISAPTSSNGDRRSSVYAPVGATWASLIDESALENVPDRERKRQESIFEFIATEATYVQSLQLIIEVFFTALQPVLAPKASSIIFANVEDILMFNTIFLSELEERQRVSRLYVDAIGDVVRTHLRGLDVYRGYCLNQSNAARTLADLKASDPNLRTLLDGLRAKNLAIEHFLLEPMQRLTRYPLLIHQILRYTEPDHPDHESLTKSLRIAESILGVVNEAVRSQEDEEKLVALSDNLTFPGVDARLELSAPTRLLGPRKILKEGQVSKVKSGRQLQAYLFNDLLLFTEMKKPGSEVVYRWPIPLEECAIREYRGDESSFQVAHRGETINVRALTLRQCAAWTKEIEAARRVCLDALEKRRASRS